MINEAVALHLGENHKLNISFVASYETTHNLGEFTEKGVRIISPTYDPED